MPELPEVEAIANQLADKLTGQVIAEGALVSISALKTFAPPLEALAGLEIEGVSRHGKFVDVVAQGIHLIFHLARAGWVTWHEVAPKVPGRPGKSGLAFRLVLGDGSGFSLTEAGTTKHLAIYIVTDPMQVPGVAALGPDPLAPGFTVDDLYEILQRAGKSQLKGLLRDQKILAGIGNAYSDEILYDVKLSPFAPASSLSKERTTDLLASIRSVLGTAIAATSGVPLNELKDAKRRGMRVHAKAGETCERCSSVIAEVSFADSSLQYCPGCQTGGKKLADRRLSRLLK